MGPKFQIIIDVDDFRHWSLTINGKKIERATAFSIDLRADSTDPITYTVSEYAISNTDWNKKVNGEYSFPLHGE